MGEPRQRVISSGSDEECGSERDRVAAGSLRIGSFLDTGVIFCLMASISRLRRRSRCECNPPPHPPPPSASQSDGRPPARTHFTSETLQHFPAGSKQGEKNADNPQAPGFFFCCDKTNREQLRPAGPQKVPEEEDEVEVEEEEQEEEQDWDATVSRGCCHWRD